MQPTLSEVQKQFTQWRSNRQNLTENTPEYLWEAARALLPQYKVTQIAKTLGINPQKLKTKEIVSPSFSSVEVCFNSLSSLKVQFTLGKKDIFIECNTDQLESLFSILSKEQ